MDRAQFLPVSDAATNFLDFLLTESMPHDKVQSDHVQVTVIKIQSKGGAAKQSVLDVTSGQSRGSYSW